MDLHILRKLTKNEVSFDFMYIAVGHFFSAEQLDFPHTACTVTSDQSFYFVDKPLIDHQHYHGLRQTGTSRWQNSRAGPSAQYSLQAIFHLRDSLDYLD